VYVHTSGEVDGFNTHCLAFIAVAMYQIDGNFLTVFKFIGKKNIWLSFCVGLTRCSLEPMRNVIVHK